MSVRTKEPRPTGSPSWAEYWADVDDRDWLFARELAEISPAVRGFVESRIHWHDEPVLVTDPDDEWSAAPDPEGWVWRNLTVHWDQVAEDFDVWGGSSTERRLMRLVLSLLVPGREVSLSQDLGQMGSWSDEVAAILGRYVAGGRARNPF